MVESIDFAAPGSRETAAARPPISASSRLPIFDLGRNLGSRLHADRKAEALEPTSKAIGYLRGIAAVEVAGAEVAIGNRVTQHVVDGREHRGRDCNDRFLGTASALEPV